MGDVDDLFIREDLLSGEVLARTEPASVFTLRMSPLHSTGTHLLKQLVEGTYHPGIIIVETTYRQWRLGGFVRGLRYAFSPVWKRLLGWEIPAELASASKGRIR